MSESEQYLARGLDNIKGLIDVNKTVGNPVITEDGRIIIPVSEIKLCFLSGGGEYGDDAPHPFGAATGGNVIMKPTGFIIIDKEEVKTLTMSKNTVVNELFDMIPQMLKKWMKK